jgi:hypothetical protein
MQKITATRKRLRQMSKLVSNELSVSSPVTQTTSEPTSKQITEPIVSLTLQDDGEGNVILVASGEDGTQASLLTIDDLGHILLHTRIPYALGLDTDNDGCLLVAVEDVS